MALFHLLYGSLATKEISDAEIVKILHTSRVRNQKDGLTGLLLFRSQMFLQVLEGEEEKVRSTYSRIVADPRHHETRIFLEFSSDQRFFPQWTMGYPERAGVKKAGDDLFGLVQSLVDQDEDQKAAVVSALKRFNLG